MIKTPGDFAGNETAAAAVRDIMDSGRFPRLIVIEGESGTGKKTLASIIAEGAVCENDDRPCGRCKGCLKFSTGHPDVTRIGVDSGKKRATIGVEDIRSVVSDAYVLPGEAARKVYIIYDADRLTQQAQNALLKTVEDGPDYTLFIFLCTSRFMLLETVISRSNVLSLSPVSLSDEKEYLKIRHPELSDEKCEELCAVSGGVIGRAERIISGEDDGAQKDLIFLAGCIAGGAQTEFMTKLISLSDDRHKMSDLLDELCILVRDALSLKTGATLLIMPSHAEASRKLCSAFSAERLVRIYESVCTAKESVLKNVSISLIIALTAAEIFDVK